ncbi:MAG: sulfur transferase domain-containing protein [Vicinamibacterales bacterium]
MSYRACVSVALSFAVGLGLVTLSAQQPTKSAVPGVTNFARVETTIACGGATTTEAFPELKKMGFKSVINLRQASEKGVNIPEAEAAAKAAGLTYLHIPFDGAKPDPAVADRFVAEITKPANNPSYVHCASANRAAAMWMIKRLTVDHWDVAKASTEAEGLGLTNAALKDFAIKYAEAHKH